MTTNYILNNGRCQILEHTKAIIHTLLMLYFHICFSVFFCLHNLESENYLLNIVKYDKTITLTL